MVGPFSQRGLITVPLACFCVLTTYLPFSGVSTVLGVIGSEIKWL
jgi:hypothetical protein